MAENPDQSQGQQQQVQLRIDESKMHLSYANTIRTSTTADEVILDFGVNLPMPTQDQSPAMMFSVGSRVIMNWKGAKRLAISLGRVIRAYEERHGEIDLGQSPGAGGPQPGGGANEPPAGPRLSE